MDILSSGHQESYEIITSCLCSFGFVQSVQKEVHAAVLQRGLG